MKTKLFQGNKINIINDKNENLDDELREEYDLSKMDLKPNPYTKDKKMTVELTPDVARFFKTPKQVNDYLRKQIKLFKSAVL
jgi:hypothetical protein